MVLMMAISVEIQQKTVADAIRLSSSDVRRLWQKYKGTYKKAYRDYEETYRSSYLQSQCDEQTDGQTSSLYQ